MKTEMSVERKLVLEIVTRMRESEQVAKQSAGIERKIWNCRANTLNEIYTEVRGVLIGPK